MRRVLVVGVTGAGKTTAAHELARRLDLPFHEMDALALGPDFTVRADLVDTVRALVARPAWVVDSLGYEPVRQLLWAAADTIVWLDYPLRVVLPRVLRRSLLRSVRREMIFNGNRETWRGWLDGEHPVWWALRTAGPRRREIAARSQAAPHLHTVRLTRPAEYRRWLATRVP